MKNLNIVVKKLIKKKITVSVAESCTGGLLAYSFIKNKNSSKIFIGGYITYSNEMKMKELKVRKDSLKKHGAVSYECCLAMVENLSKITKTKINISITGIAGPNGGTKLKPVGLVYIGIKKDNKIQINKCLFKDKKRSLIQKATVEKTLNLLLGISK